MTPTFRVPARIVSVLVLVISSSLIVMAQNAVPFLGQPLVPDAVAPGGPGFTLAVN